ncbi:hypothetical protein Q0F99_19950 [Rathayibacter oskolensis]|uniref:hypothetical protein n=1 Tax=Rathayibacter oskolensis TaxID=1891671 RepID=UPI00265F9234|nr:hypothetical protein [Rathayibacter oskolensis]WKK71567.1 hypothetical protein Q0F99_19950 [Rathayibacter oskolensis]
MIPGNFDWQRSAVRDQTFPNQRAEREAIRAVDKAIFDEVRVHERRLVRDGQKIVADVAARRRAVEQIVDQLTSEITTPFAKASWSDSAMDVSSGVDRYNILFSQLETALAALGDKYRELTWIADKLDDPYTDLAKLLTKFFSGTKRSDTAPVRFATTDGNAPAVGGSADARPHERGLPRGLPQVRHVDPVGAATA